MAVLSPGIIPKPGAHGGFGIALDEVGGAVANADRTPDNYYAVNDELIHELGMPVPPVLIADPSLVVPRRPVDKHAKKVRHAGRH